MGNTVQTSATSNSQTTTIDNRQNEDVYKQMLHLLSSFCTNDQFPLNVFQQATKDSSHYEIIDIISNPRHSDGFSKLVIKLIWNDRKSIPREEVTKLFSDCCIFDIKRALYDDDKQLQMNMIDKECFIALTKSIRKGSTSDVEEEQFHQWVHVQFPALFYGLEMWLRNNVASSTNNKNKTSQPTAKKHSLIKMNNILNPTWVWLLVHNLPILYLSADDTCTNLFERMSSILYGRMWDHLYDSFQDGSSLNRFQHHIFGYKGPIITLFELSDGYLFCLCCDQEFKESPKHFGGIQACLIQLKPVFKTVVEGENIIFMNTKLRGVSELGLFIGRDHKNALLQIDDDFFNAKHINGEGRVVSIDVWGVGGRKSAEEQEGMREWESKQIEKSRKVKRSYADEEAILNMAGIETRHVQEQL